MNSSLINAAAEAISNGDLEKVKLLVDENEQLLHAQLDQTEYTLLHEAARHNEIEIVEYLLSAGAPIEAYPQSSYMPNDRGAGSGTWTALALALNSEFYEIAELIGSYKISPKNLWTAVGLGRMDLVKSFFVPDGELNDSAGDPGKLQTKQEILDDAFNMACHTGRKQFMDFLLSKGANINGKDHWGMTGLHWSVDSHPEHVQYLVERGASVINRDAQHLATPLGFALYQEKTEIAEYFIEHCTLHICDAVALGRFDLVKEIVEEKPMLANGPLSLGEPVRVAARKGFEDIFDYLVSKGADFKNDEVRTGMFDFPELKYTALGWANESGNHKIAEKLVSMGAHN